MQLRLPDHEVSTMTRKVQDIVDEQIARWRVEQQERQQSPAGERPRPAAIAISHAIGSFGVGTGQFAGAMLGIPVFDRQVLEHVAKSARVQLETVRTLDERAQSFVDDHLCALFRERGFDQSEYMRLLARAVAALWAHGPAVFVGHGSVHLIPRGHTLTVRTVAPQDVRVRRVAKAYQLTFREALRKVKETDRERAAFHRRLFQADVQGPYHYDLVLNTVGLSVLGAARIVAEAYRQKFSLAQQRSLAASA
jgi:cytidylate kinase